MKQFTIKGTVISINDKEQEGYETKYIYTTAKEVFDKAIDELIRSFIDEEKYESYLESSQKEIVDNGYDLSINKYKEVEYVPVEYPSTEEIMADLRELEMKISEEMDALEKLLNL